MPASATIATVMLAATATAHALVPVVPVTLHAACKPPQNMISNLFLLIG